MKKFTLFFCVFLSLIIVSCNTQQPSVEQVVKDFADLECRAMMLREKRFALANQIRFTQDTLFQHSKNPDTTRLKLNLEVMNKEKESVLQHSVALADTIHNVLDSLMKNQLADQKNKAAFDQMLDTTLKQRGCVDKGTE